MCDNVLQAKGQFKRRSTANNVDIIVPVPADADSPKFRVSELDNMCTLFVLMYVLLFITLYLQASHGFAKYHPEKSALVWSIKTFPVSVDI